MIIDDLYTYRRRLSAQRIEVLRSSLQVDMARACGVHEQLLRGSEHARGALLYQMDTGVRLTLQNARAFGENIISKNEVSLGEKPNFGSKLGRIG